MRSLSLCDTRLLHPWDFSRQEYWSGLPSPSPGDLPSPGLPHCRQTLYHLSHQGSVVTDFKMLNLKEKSLEYSWLTVLCQFQVCSQVNHLYIYPLPTDRGVWQATVHSVAESDTTEVTQHSLFRFFSHTGHYRVLSKVPCAVSRSLLVTYFLCMSY